MKITKSQAKQEVELYGQLLQDRGLISEIDTEEIRDQIRYSFLIFDVKYSYKQECMGVLELSRVLSSMWSAYSRARADIGLDT